MDVPDSPEAAALALLLLALDRKDGADTLLALYCRCFAAVRGERSWGEAGDQEMRARH